MATDSATPNGNSQRPELDRLESNHEYGGDGLDESPRTPTRGHIRAPSRQKNGTPKAEEAGKNGNPTFAEVAQADAPIDSDKPQSNGEKSRQDETQGGKANGADKDGAEESKEEPYPDIPDDEENSEELLQRKQDQANGYRAAGIRFAPWNVPVRRRLQTLTVLLHCLSIGGLVSVFFFLCANPLLWPILLPYLIYILLSNAATNGRLGLRSERFRRWRAWKLFADYFPASLHKTHDLPATRKYIFGYHPHGIISHGAWAAFATEALGFSEKFPGITNSLLTLDSNFRIPIYREYILAMGLRSVSKESIGNFLTRGGPNGEGMGRAVTIVVGGARESLSAQPGQLRLVINERKGFVKLALRTGADLVPVLAFGENDLYDQLQPETHPAIHRFQKFALKALKFTLPFLHGRGIFNYDVGMMPYRHPLRIVVGAPVKVAQAYGGNVDPAEVDRLHGLYCEELRKIWETYKDEFAKDRKEEMVFVS